MPLRLHAGYGAAPSGAPGGGPGGNFGGGDQYGAPAAGGMAGPGGYGGAQRSIVHGVCLRVMELAWKCELCAVVFVASMHSAAAATAIQ